MSLHLQPVPEAEPTEADAAPTLPAFARFADSNGQVLAISCAPDGSILLQVPTARSTRQHLLDRFQAEALRSALDMLLDRTHRFEVQPL